MINFRKKRGKLNWNDNSWNMRKSHEVKWQADIRVTKTDEDQQLVFGWASVTHIDGEIVIDKQGDIISSEELEKAAYDFVLYCREQGDMHERRGVGKLVESCVFTEEKMAKCGLYAFDPETNEQMFGWLVGFKVQTPDVWSRVRDGSLPQFSIGGRAIRVPVDDVSKKFNITKNNPNHDEQGRFSAGEGGGSGGSSSVDHYVGRLEETLGTDKFDHVFEGLKSNHSITQEALVSIASKFAGHTPPKMPRNKVLDRIYNRHRVLVRFAAESERTGVGRRSAS